MTRSVADAFKILLDRIQPLPREKAAKDNRRITISQGLAREFPGFDRLVVFGSHSRGTAIRGRSDVDYLAIVANDDIKRGGALVDSSSTLARVRKALQARFETTNVRTRGCAAIIEFAQATQAVDVVPAAWATTAPTSGHPVFRIPDGNGGWRMTSPAAHKKFLDDANRASGRHLYYTAQILKAWRVGRSAPIPFLSFHVELLLAQLGVCSVAKPYSVCLRDALRVIRDRKAASLPDPVGISGNIPIAFTTLQAEDVVRCAAVAAERVDNALRAEQAQDVRDAFRLWSLVLPQFPGFWGR